MTRELAIAINIYIVPLMAVLLSLYGINMGGVGVVYIDCIIYLINCLLVYFLFFLLSRIIHNRIVYYLTIMIYLFLLEYLSSLFSPYLFFLYFILVLHLFFFTKVDDFEVDFEKSIFRNAIENIPRLNLVLFSFFSVISIFLAVSNAR
jgi:hypothetical protein